MNFDRNVNAPRSDALGFLLRRERENNSLSGVAAAAVWQRLAAGVWELVSSWGLESVRNVGGRVQALSQGWGPSQPQGWLEAALSATLMTTQAESFPRLCFWFIGQLFYFTTRSIG